MNTVFAVCRGMFSTEGEAVAQQLEILFYFL